MRRSILASMVPPVFAVFFLLVVSQSACSFLVTPSSAPAAPENKPRMIQFSGYDWKVKASTRRVGPGPNYFSDSTDNVWVDNRGLHLRITQRNGNFYAAEVVSDRSFGYGTYRFRVGSNTDNLDPRAVLGLFTWSDAPEFHHREIDVEISRWGQPENDDCQFVLQPYRRAGNMVRFRLPRGLDGSTHSFKWSRGSLFCQSLRGSKAEPTDAAAVIKQHTFAAGLPEPGGENARINLWLLGGRPPLDGKEHEVIISRFEHVPE
jgi:hypothetical protein